MLLMLLLMVVVLLLLLLQLPQTLALSNGGTADDVRVLRLQWISGSIEASPGHWWRHARRSSSAATGSSRDGSRSTANRLLNRLLITVHVGARFDKALMRRRQ